MYVFSRQPRGNATLHLDGRQVERVKSFKYLGGIINDQLNPDNEIKSRIESGRFTFNKIRSLFCDDNLNLKLRQRMVKCYVWPIFLYGVEAWTLKVTTLNRLEAFEMWIFRRMLRIPRVERVTSRDVLKRSNTQRELINVVRCWKISYLGHVLIGCFN